MHAAQHGNVEIIKLLLKHGAKLDALDDKEFNAADYARMGNKPENIDYLKSLGLRENRPNETWVSIDAVYFVHRILQALATLTADIHLRLSGAHYNTNNGRETRFLYPLVAK